MSEPESLVERLERAAKNADETLGWLANHEDSGASPIWEAQAEYEEDAKAIREAAAELSTLRSELDRLAGLESESAEASDIVAELNAEVVALRSRCETAERELAAFMIRNSFATGHGDTFYDLLAELEWQVRDLRAARDEAVAALEEIRRKVHAHNRGGGLSLLLRKEIRDIADASLGSITDG